MYLLGLFFFLIDLCGMKILVFGNILLFIFGKDKLELCDKLDLDKLIEWIGNLWFDFIVEELNCVVIEFLWLMLILFVFDILKLWLFVVLKDLLELFLW